MRFDAEARGGLDQFGDLRHWLCTELARFALQRVRRKHEPGRILVAHRLLDLSDRFDTVFLEIGENPDEAGPEFGPAFFEMCPIDDIPSLVGHRLLLKRRFPPAVVPLAAGIARKG